MNVPKLRFKEFSEDWEEKKLSDIGLITTGNTPSTLNRDYYNGNEMFVSPADMQGNRYINNTKSTLTQLGFSKGRKVKKNSVCFVCIGSTIGKVAQLTKDSLTNQQINCLTANINNFDDFIYSLLELKAPYIKLLAGEQAVPLINKTDFSNLKFFLPSKKEQEKIASFLSSLDKKIEILDKKISLLQKYKKGLMQKIFSQVLRFKANDGSNFPDWEEKKLGNYLTQKSIKNKDCAVKLVLSVSNKKGFITQGEQFNGYEVASKDLSNYKIIKKNEYAYNPSRINVGSIARLENFSIGIVSPMYVAFELKDSLNHIYFNSLFQTNKFKYQIKTGCSGSVRDSLNFDDMSDFKINLPSLEEQEKIANFLASIDKKIEFIKEDLELTKKFKKALLQGMFV